MLRSYIVIIVILLALSAHAQEGEPASSSKKLSYECDVPKAKTFASELEVKIVPPAGWCLISDQGGEYIDYISPKEEFPNSFMATGGKLWTPFSQLVKVDIERLTKVDEEHKPIAKSISPLRGGEVVVYQLDDETAKSVSLIGYMNVKDKFMVKMMLINHATSMPENLRQAFDTFVLKAEITLKAPADSQAEALAEASSRVQKAGQEAITNVKYSGGDGSSLEKAIIIRNATNMFGCVSAQYAWLDGHYPGYQFMMHAGGEEKGKRLSHMTISHKGKEINLIFDVTDCEKP